MRRWSLIRSDPEVWRTPDNGHYDSDSPCVTVSCDAFTPIFVLQLIDLHSNVFS